MELGKTDAEMDSDPSLSMSNLMTFDPDAEDGDPPELIKQEVGRHSCLTSPFFSIFFFEFFVFWSF